MSRDFTPQEQQWADKQLHMREKRITWKNTATGEEELLVDPECETAKRYPNLYFLYGYYLEKHLLQEFPSSFVLEVEQKLRQIIRQEDSSNKPLQSCVDMNGTIANKPSVLMALVASWYTGKLDSDFYYSDRNNQLFYEGLQYVFSIENNKLSIERYKVVLGFNTKKYWIYDATKEAYIDPPSSLLDIVNNVYRDELHDVDEDDPRELLLERICNVVQPSWLNDANHTYKELEI